MNFHKILFSELFTYEQISNADLTHSKVIGLQSEGHWQHYSTEVSWEEARSSSNIPIENCSRETSE